MGSAIYDAFTGSYFAVTSSAKEKQRLYQASFVEFFPWLRHSNEVEAMYNCSICVNAKVAKKIIHNGMGCKNLRKSARTVQITDFEARCDFTVTKLK